MNTREWIDLIDRTLQSLRSALRLFDETEAGQLERAKSAIAAADEWYEDRDLPPVPASEASEPPEATAEMVELPDEEIEARLAAGASIPEIDDFSEGVPSLHDLRTEIRRLAVVLERRTRRENW